MIICWLRRAYLDAMQREANVALDAAGLADKVPGVAVRAAIFRVCASAVRALFRVRKPTAALQHDQLVEKLRAIVNPSEKRYVLD